MIFSFVLKYECMVCFALQAWDFAILARLSRVCRVDLSGLRSSSGSGGGDEPTAAAQ